MIASALSGQSPFHLEYLVDDLNLVKAGTSGAAGFVAGLVALLLERDPGLDPDQVKARLYPHCSVPGRAAGTFDPKWGYGVIDADRLCQAMQPVPGR